MATTEERMRILKMIQEGKITAEEGAKLLAALRELRKTDNKKWLENFEPISQKKAVFLHRKPYNTQTTTLQIPKTLIRTIHTII